MLLLESSRLARYSCPKAGISAPTAWAELVPGDSLAFKTVGQPDSVQLVPFYKIFRERYTTYWKVTTA
ncbi:MAG: hypothetical protein ACRD4A_06490 [Candidatus Acidiferrales bacterium]